MGLIGRRKDSNASAKPEMPGRCAPAREYTGDDGEDRVGRRAFRIVIADRTQSDLDDVTLSNRSIRELVVFSPVPGPVPITSLDAIAIGFSQNAFPGTRVQ